MGKSYSSGPSDEREEDLAAGAIKPPHTCSEGKGEAHHLF